MLKYGFAHADITPSLDDKPHGSYRPQVMTGVHDPLRAAACVVDDGHRPLALVGIDAGVIMRDTFVRAAELIAQRTPLNASNLIVSASHTHRGGSSLSTFAAVADPDYAILVADRIADAVTQAWNNRAAGQCASASAEVTGIHFNRRFHMRDGRQVTHPGKLHPDIVAPAGPVDPKVSALVFRNAAGAITGVVVNFGCHCTVTEEDPVYSADYVHYLREHLKRSLGPIEVVFLLGACGDVTQIDNLAPEWEKGHAHADKMGAVLARAISQILPTLTWSPTAACGVANQKLRLPIRPHDASPPPTLGLGSGDFWETTFANERELMAQRRAATPTVDCHITAVRVGDLAIVANGAELFAQPALDIQRASPFAQTWTVTLANEYLGYVPTATAHFAGGYEPRIARSSFLAIETAQQLTEASIRALHSSARAAAQRAK